VVSDSQLSCLICGSDGGVRGMATTTEILLASSKTQERVAETATRAPPYSAAKPRWYRPDPVTGTWLPEAESEGDETSVTKSVIPPALTARIRAESTDSTQDKRWWTSMEELPDMDRPNWKTCNPNWRISSKETIRECDTCVVSVTGIVDFLTRILVSMQWGFQRTKEWFVWIPYAQNL